MIYKIADFVVFAVLWALVAVFVVIAVAASIMAFGWWSIAFWVVAACVFISVCRPNEGMSPL